jgi:autotransporter family porin
MVRQTVAALPLLLTMLAHADGVIYVNAAANGANDGTSWRDAFTDLQDALAVAASGDQIWVASGMYFPNTVGAFELVDGTSLYGGFAGWEDALEDRDWKENETILTSEAGVLRAEGLVAGSLVDGFIIRRDGWIQPTAVSILDAIVAFENCTFSNNYTFGLFGGALHVVKSVLTLNNTTFIDNRTPGADFGGAIRLIDSELFAAKSMFLANRSGQGGAIASERSEMTL